MSYEEMLLHMGMTMGALTLPSNFARLVAGLSEGTLRRDYVVILRDHLTMALDAANVPKSPGEIQ